MLPNKREKKMCTYICICIIKGEVYLKETVIKRNLYKFICGVIKVTDSLLKLLQGT